MKHVLFCASLLLLACQDHSPADLAISIPIVNSTANGGNLPAIIVGAYALENAILNGPEFEVVVEANPEVVVAYQPGADITYLVRQIVFRGVGDVPYSVSCSQSQLAIEFKSNGSTSHVCLGSNSNSVDMGFWNTTGAENDLLAWSIMHDNQIIECEIVPYTVNTELLEGYLVFPLPRNTLIPLQEGENQQYRKIKITLRKV